MLTALLVLRLACAAGAAPAAPTRPARASAAQTLLARALAAYYRGDAQTALALYAKAAKASPRSARPWRDGSVLLDELGRRKTAVRWLQAAAARRPDAETLDALGWDQWRSGKLAAAAATFHRALARDPKSSYSLLGAARVALDRGRAREALKLLERASDAAPLLNLVPYYQGQAYERLGDSAHAAEAYRQAVISDSYFLEARDALGRLAVKRRNYGEAYRQFTRMLDAEPANKRLIALVRRVERLLRPGSSVWIGESRARRAPAAVAPTVVGLNVPTIRVGIGTNAMGRPRARQSLAFKVNVPFRLVDSAGGRTLARGGAGEPWQVRLKRFKRKRFIVVLDGSGKEACRVRTPLVIEPSSPETSAITLEDVPLPHSGGPVLSGKMLRGRLELAIFRSNLRLVNIVDLETYTHGVVAAEMPIRSPIEALKAQAILARSHALFIKEVSRRHRKEGYDVCDGEHCQVYLGIRAESARSREVVEATRGQIVTYRGRVAHVIFSSNCGGHTQSGKDVGWGDVPYWQGIRDSPAQDDAPLSPWRLRLRLKSWPQAFCQPSNDVHPSHYRWSRIVSLRELDERLARKYRLGRLKWVRALKRSASGNVDSVLLQGTRRSVRLTDEMKIRSLLAPGSLRSTQFVIEPEYGANGRVAAFVFHGGGWGHGVGLCQSGAMGRADAGQTAEQIIKAYFQGVELGRLQY